MGFGRLLKLKIDEIPAKMGHFVVDSFCPKKMQIIVEKNKIKINCEAIHKLLGVPCGDVTIESMGKLKKGDESVKAWRNRYSGNFVAPTELVSKIETAEDEDCFNFRMDFLMCFLAVMVECHEQGRCKEKILDKLMKQILVQLIGKFKRLSKVTVEEDEGNIGYSVGDEIEVLEKLLDVLHKQKNLFDSKLGRLLENHKEQQEVSELKEKYNLLTQNTGKRGVQSEAGTDKEGENDTSAGVEQDQQEKAGDSEDNGVVDHDQQQPEDTEENAGGENDNVQDSEANVGWKNDEEKGGGELLESDAVTFSLEHGEIGEINVSKDTGIKTLENSILEVEKQASVNALELNKETTKKNQDCKETSKEGNTEEEKTNEIVYNAPPFSIGLTQLESNNEELDTGKEKVDSQQGLSVRQEADVSTLHQNKSEYVYDGPSFSIGLTQLESLYCADETKSNMEKRSDEVESSDIRGENEEIIEGNREKVIKMEEKRRNSIREIGLPISSKSPYKIRGVDITEANTKEEELV
ncbi:hypothetical protein L1987_54484 [Smallanthus sonchifolius]|uniref:Uncharacterized protein n=1 Tax=Smallanthus sonchifolius TaxID=185202 RepID=A0ACB9E7C4_9ASTR|nr:hypothetical protein L1987_54484 [Smallanthus sonchifolius]